MRPLVDYFIKGFHSSSRPAEINPSPPSHENLISSEDPLTELLFPGIHEKTNLEEEGSLALSKTRPLIDLIQRSLKRGDLAIESTVNLYSQSQSNSKSQIFAYVNLVQALAKTYDQHSLSEILSYHGDHSMDFEHWHAVSHLIYTKLKNHHNQLHIPRSYDHLQSNEKAFTSILKGIEIYCTTHKKPIFLDLEQSSLSRADVLLLCQAITNNQISHLNLNRSHLNDDDAQLLAEAIKNSAVFFQLDISENSLSSQGARVLTDVFCSKDMCTLDISHNNIEESVALELERKAASCTTALLI